ncbi:hypothetical protein G6F31_016570 [Rhizopus arrhizus]|nr:hypothetical protein G6F31_016570 [Rhizopus arrhizus]
MVVVITISRDFSSLSAICPASAENRKYGRMKMAGASVAYSPNVVIERTERLDHEERQETALAQQGELVVTGHGASLTGAA